MVAACLLVGVAQAASAASAASTPESLGFSSERLAELDRYMQQLVTDGHIPGGTLRGEGSFDWSGAAGTWFWVDPRNDLIFIGMIQVMNRWQHPLLKNIDKQTTALVYRALVEPQR